jgi:hypothetical protein
MSQAMRPWFSVPKPHPMSIFHFTFPNCRTYGIFSLERQGEFQMSSQGLLFSESASTTKTIKNLQIGKKSYNNVGIEEDEIGSGMRALCDDHFIWFVLPTNSTYNVFLLE